MNRSRILTDACGPSDNAATVAPHLVGASVGIHRLPFSLQTYNPQPGFLFPSLRPTAGHITPQASCSEDESLLRCLRTKRGHRNGGRGGQEESEHASTEDLHVWRQCRCPAFVRSGVSSNYDYLNLGGFTWNLRR